MPSTKIRKKILTVLFYGLLGGASSLVLFLIFYWSLRLNASIYNLVTFYRDLPLYFWPYVILTIATLILFGIHVPLLVYRWRKYGLPKIGGPAGAGVGSVIGILASACPVCGSALLSIIGIAGGLAAFPFGGLELKAVSFGFMAVPLVLTGRELQRFAKGGDACPVPHDSSLKAKERPWLVILLVAVVVLGYVAVTMLAGDPIFFGLQKQAGIINTPTGNNPLYDEVVANVLPEKGFQSKIAKIPNLLPQSRGGAGCGV